MSAEARFDLDPEQTERGWRLSVYDLSEDDARDMAAGYVPDHVRAILLNLLEYRRIDEARAARPVRKKKHA